MDNERHVLETPRDERELHSNSAVERLVKAPIVVCLCGSTRFKDAIVEVNRLQTTWGKIVLAPGVFGHAGDPLTDDTKARLDDLHLRKIDMADEVLVVNVGGHIGDSTRREIAYAEAAGKRIMFTEAF